MATAVQPIRPVHLVLYAADSIKRSDVNTFHAAAGVLASDYRRLYPKDTVELKGFKTGREFVQIIGSFPDRSIVSLDVVSHGNQAGLHVSRRLKPALVSPGSKAWWHYRLRGADQLNLDPQYPQTREDAKFMEESMHGLYSSSSMAVWVGRYYNQQLYTDPSAWFGSDLMEGVATLSEVQFGRFARPTFVEFHGCRVAEQIDYFNAAVDNFAKDFADKLAAGSIVVGHITNNFPNDHPSGRANDYRQNRVRIYRSTKLSSEVLHDGKGIERNGATWPNSSTP